MPSLPGSLRALIVVSLIAAATLRLAFPRDVEYKRDESVMWGLAHSDSLATTMGGLGMPSGVGLRNPALSAGVFVALTRATEPATPAELARGVACMALAALGLLALFAVTQVEAEHRAAWIWALALACVNPLAVLLQRKIWAQSVLPVFCIAYVAAWWHRRHPYGAFAWGLIGALLGQIHMSGFVFALAIAVWTALAGWLGGRTGTRWIAWFLGSLCGGLVLLPWVLYVAVSPRNGSNLLEILSKFATDPAAHTLFWQFWLTDATGTGLVYSLGPEHFASFLRSPEVAGGATWLMAALHLVVLVAVAPPLARELARLWNESSLREQLVRGMQTDTGLLVQAAFVGFGLLFALSGIHLVRHYLVVTFPLEWLWLSSVVLRHSARPGRTLGAVWLAQLSISAGFLLYIHAHGGAPGGDYGVVFDRQFPLP